MQQGQQRVADNNLITTSDGRRISAERWRYEQNAKQEAVLRNVNTLIQRDATAAVSVAAGFAQQEYGGFLRDIIPPLLDQYGQVNATAAVNYYNELQDVYRQQYPERTSSRTNTKRKAQRFAGAQVSAAFQVQQDQGRFLARYATTYNTLGKSDSVINYAMKVRATLGHTPSVEAMNRALTREVASYHRDTVLFNAALDPNVDRVQRVAQYGACEFCRLMALGSTNGTVRTSTYAIKFHANCHCTITPLFVGESPVRPDYYDDFEKQYQEATKGNSRTDDILAAWRKQARGGARPLSIVEPTPTVSSVDLDFLDRVTKAKTPKEIVGHLEQKWSARGIEFRNLGKSTFNVETTREVAVTFDKLLTEFPKANISALQTKESKGSAFAWVASRNKVTFTGPVEPGNISDILTKRQVENYGINEMTIVGRWMRERDELVKQMGHGAKEKHFHDVNLEKPMEYIVSHEFGHVLDFTLKRAGKNFNILDVRRQYLLETKGIDKVGREAYEAMLSESSAYGRSSSAELIAEVFADVRVNGDKAKGFSKYAYQKFMELVNEL